MNRLVLCFLLLCLTTGCFSTYELDGKKVPHGKVKDALSADVPRGLFPGMPTPLQIGIGSWALFNPAETTVYGIFMNLLNGKVDNCYGLSLALLSANYNMYGVSACLFSNNQNAHGLSLGLLNLYEENHGVSIGIYNIMANTEKGSFRKSLLQIGLFNLTETGLQIGLINGNENAKIRILPFFNYSPVK